MKKNLTRFFSLLLAALTVMSVSAAPLAKRKMTAPKTESAAVKTVKQKAPAKGSVRPTLSPKFRTPAGKSGNLFRSATPRKHVPVKAPLKVGARVNADMPDMMGSVTYSDAWMSTWPVGLYTIPTNASESFVMKIDGPNGNYGGVLVGTTYYVCDVIDYDLFFDISYIGYDMETGAQVYESPYSFATASMTYDNTSATVYGVAWVENAWALVKITFGTEVEFEVVGPCAPAGDTMWNSIACDSNGQLWGIAGNYSGNDCISSTLYKINKSTGALTKIGDTGFDCAYMSDMTFDLKTDKLYWTVSPSDYTGFLAEVNTVTGAASVVYMFPDNEEVTGLVIPAPIAADGAPAAVANAKAEFAGGALTGTVSFTAPTTLFDGTPATGELTYSVKANGVEVASGTTTFGAEVSDEITMAAEGVYDFSITVANAAGISPAANVKGIFVGKDTPAAPSVTVTYDKESNTATVTWTAVTGTVNGGYMDASAVTYTVTRYPDEVVVAENIKATTVTDKLPDTDGMSKYYYEVVATCDGLSSAPGLSPEIMTGSGLVPPFLMTFDDYTSLEYFTIIDANGDGDTWKAAEGHVRVDYNRFFGPMDDWLITPPIKLEAGELYDVYADLWAQASGYTERVEIYMGTAPTVEGMTTMLLSPTDISTTMYNPFKFSKAITVPEAGMYYIGFHGISEADKYYLNLDNFGVTAPRTGDGPAMVTDLMALTDPTGALKATVSFVTPTKAINGKALTSLDKVVLSRDGKEINTWTAPAPGDALSFTDELPDGGMHYYSVVAANEAGDGLVADVSVFVGIDTPSYPENVDLVQTANPGEITISWDPVTTDVRGTTLPAGKVKYQIYTIVSGYYREPISEKISETSYTFQAVNPGMQSFVQYLVFAYYDDEESDGVYTPFKPVGTPYTSYSMTRESDFDEYILGSDASGGCEWSAATDATFDEVSSADGDNLYFYMQGTYLQEYGTLVSGLIDLSAIASPGMTFYTMPVDAEDINILTVTVTDAATGVDTEVFSKRVNDIGEPMEWSMVTIDLAAFAQQTVTIQITGTICDFTTIIVIDGWKVKSMLDNDLAVTALNAPPRVNAGQQFVIEAVVANEGLKAADAFTVELYADGVAVDTKEVASLAANTKTTVKFTTALSAVATEPVEYTAKVVFAADQNAANDMSKPANVAPILSHLPAPDDLAATTTATAVELTWSEPDLANAPGNPVTEDFEDADSFTAEYGHWIFIDRDKSEVGGFENIDIPGITPGDTKGSFWVWDTDKLTFDDLAAHSGSKFLFTMFRWDGGDSDEWAISPELYGTAQTISFYAMSYSATFPDKIEVYYSTGSTDPADFIKVNNVGGYLPDTWTLVAADLPDGAKRFAIRSCATDSWMLMVDDVTFTPAGSSAADLELKGYDVYRDGVKINEAIVEECDFTDTNVVEGQTYQYVVVAVYSTGFSAPSSAVTVLYQASGLESIYGSALNISAARGQIIVTGAEGQAVAVYTVDGKTIFAGRGEAKTVIPAQQGIYVVKAGTTVKKLRVK